MRTEASSRRRRRWAGAVGIIIALVLALPVAGRARAIAMAAGVGRPTQYTGLSHVAVDPSVLRLLAVAHNAGDHAVTADRAVTHDAGAVEFDVMLDGRRLIARHNASWPIISDRLPGGRPFAQAWAAVGTTAVLLDLKSTSPSALRLVLTEIDRHPSSRVLVSTSSTAGLERLRRTAPAVTRLLTVKSSAALQRILADRGRLGVVQGVSIREQLLTRDVIASLRSAHLIVQAWTVNDIARVNELARWGVDGITTDNLGVMDVVAQETKT